MTTNPTAVGLAVTGGTAALASGLERAPLITFPPALDCEVARWVLDRFRIPYIECPHSLLCLPVAIYYRGGDTSALPTLALPSKAISGARDISAHYEALATPAQRLVPVDPRGAATAEAAWLDYSVTLGNTVRTWAYYHLLPTPKAMLPVFKRGVPWLERPVVWLTYPLVRLILTRGLKLSRDAAESALLRVGTLFDAVETTLSDGRPYILGDQFTLCDLLFAVNAAPMVLPKEYGGSLPEYSATAPEFQRGVTEFRARPAGQFALRLYRDERRKTV